MAQANSRSSIHRGFHWDAVNSRLVIEVAGTEVMDMDADDLAIVPNTTVAGTLGVTGLATLATGKTSGDHEFSSTITLTGDSVGADGEQLTSGGAASVCDWASAASMREFKNLLGKVDPKEALEKVIGAPVHKFKYRETEEGGPRMMGTGDHDTEYVGIMADEAPWAMHHNGKILNPINAFGYTVAAMQAMMERITDLEGQLEAKAV